jgi:hypothetical protein
MIVKYISKNDEGIYWVWDCMEDAEENLIDGLECLSYWDPDLQVFIYEVEVEPTNLNDTNVLIEYDGWGAEFLENPKERDEENDDMIEEVYKIKRCFQAREYRLGLTTFVHSEPKFPC